MATLDANGLKNSSTGSLLIGVNETYFADASYSFFCHNKSYSIQPSFPTNQYPNIFNNTFTSGLWYVSLNVWFENSPACAAAICTTASNATQYGFDGTLYDNNNSTRLTQITTPIKYIFVSWNQSGTLASGAPNGVNTSCIINIPTTALIGVVTYGQVAGTNNMKIQITATRIGPPTSVNVVP